MDDCPLEEMMDYLKKEEVQDLSLDEDDSSNNPSNSTLVDEFMNDPQFWRTFLNEEEILKQNITKYSSVDYNSPLWSRSTLSPSPPNNYASSSSTSSDHSRSSPSRLSDFCTSVTVNDGVTLLDNSINNMGDSNHLLGNYGSLQINTRDSVSPCLSNYDSSVGAIDIGADVIVVTSSDVYIKEEEEEPDSEDGQSQSVHYESKGLVPLELSGEEKKLMEKEGIVLPKYLPLTKAEEKELKRIRRKIRNKASAQNSRKRKKEYIDGLEKRVKRCTVENNALKQAIRKMQDHNRSLVAELSQLKKLLANSSNKSVQSNTCLMVLLCSFALLLLPSLAPSSWESKDLFENEKPDQRMQGGSRTLLYSSDGWDKSKAEPLYKEDNISNLYEVIPHTASPKHCEWKFAAGQQKGKFTLPVSDEVVLGEDLKGPRKNYSEDGSVSLDTPSESLFLEAHSSPPCIQEIIIDSSPD